MISKTILFHGSREVIRCDGKCHKAWGMNGGRPEIHFSTTNPDDYVYLDDSELGDAPKSTITEKGHTRPCDTVLTDGEQMNAWCARECERVSHDASPLRDFDYPRPNIPLRRNPVEPWWPCNVHSDANPRWSLRRTDAHNPRWSLRRTDAQRCTFRFDAHENKCQSHENKRQSSAYVAVSTIHFDWCLQYLQPVSTPFDCYGRYGAKDRISTLSSRCASTSALTCSR